MKKFQFRKTILVIADFLILFFSGILSSYILYSLNLDYQVELLGKGMLTFCIVMNAVISLLTLFIFGAYSKMWRYFNKKDYLSCFIGITTGMLISTIIQKVFNAMPSLYFAILTYGFAVAGTIIFRLLFRNAFLTLDKADKVTKANSENKKQEICITGKRTLIVGAGTATRIILSELKVDPNNKLKGIVPICLVDDDPGKQDLSIDGVKVQGTTEDIKELCKAHNISLIIYSIPSSTLKQQQRILDICSKTSCEIKVVPYLSQLILGEDDSKIISQIKDIRIEDLLGREPIKFDKAEVKKIIENKTCLITGGGGSIGSELVRQIAKNNPKLILIIDIYENNAYEVQQELVMEYGNDFPVLVLIASVRDYKKMDTIFNKYRPDIVFHAAAHKHVPLMEDSPEEAVKNNILGTFNITTLAEFYESEKFIMISTDKAVNPTNVMGATKRCCEMIVQYKSQHSTKTEFVTTRFGNVLGSSGSVIPLFRKQIESGKAVTVTHPEIIRYFMTIPEAVSLVLQAGAMANGGEIFVLDMGDPVKIVTLAENLIRLYGKRPYEDVEIKFTGLRPGEKLYEELLMDEEGLESTDNKKIFIGNQISINNYDFLSKLERIIDYANDNDSKKTIELLSELVPTYNYKNKNNKNNV